MGLPSLTTQTTTYLSEARFDILEKQLQVSAISFVVSQMKQGLEKFKERNPHKIEQTAKRQQMIDRINGFLVWSLDLYTKAEATDRAFYKCSNIAQHQWTEIQELKRKIIMMEDFYSEPSTEEKG